MRPLSYEYSFDIKPGKPVFIQTAESKARGAEIIKLISEAYSPHEIFHHFKRRRGHVGALNKHQQSEWFSRLDLADFFGSVTRTKLSRALRGLGFTDRDAFKMAFDSVVVRGNRKVLPFGFCQSPLLATLALESSALGQKLIEVSNRGIITTVYMDDALLSSDDSASLAGATDEVIAAAAIAEFALAPDKVTINQPVAEIFNCNITRGRRVFTPARMEQFVADLMEANPAGAEAIERYVSTISEAELEHLRARLNPPVQGVRWFADAASGEAS